MKFLIHFKSTDVASNMLPQGVLVWDKNMMNV